MMKITVLVVLLGLSCCTMVPHIGPVDTHVPRTYKMELNDPPETMYAPIWRDYREPVTRFMEYIDLLPISKSFYDGVEWYARNEFKYQDFVS
jgi:hypothetical protein